MVPEDFLRWIAGWLGLGTAVYLLFDRAEHVTKPKIKRGISRWLQNQGHGDAVRNWPDAFIRVFDQIFGEKHLSWKCFRRSCLASVAGVVILSVFALDAQFWDELPETPAPWLKLILMVLTAVFVNLIPDYLSLLETRYLLSLMRQTDSPIARVLILVLDLLATWYAFFFFLLVLYLGAGLLTGDPDAQLQGTEWLILPIFPFGALWMTVTDATQLWGAPEATFFAILIGSTFLTSAWLWLYLAGAGALKLARRMRKGTIRAVSVFDVDRQPLRSIGMVCNLGITAAFAVVLIWQLTSTWLSG